MITLTTSEVLLLIEVLDAHIERVCGDGPDLDLAMDLHQRLQSVRDARNICSSCGAPKGSSAGFCNPCTNHALKGRGQ